MRAKKCYKWNPATYSFENGRYEIIETVKSTLTKAVPANLPAKMKKR